MLCQVLVSALYASFDEWGNLLVGFELSMAALAVPLVGVTWGAIDKRSVAQIMPKDDIRQKAANQWRGVFPYVIRSVVQIKSKPRDDTSRRLPKDRRDDSEDSV